MGIVPTAPLYFVLAVEVLGLAVAGMLAYYMVRITVRSFRLLKTSPQEKILGRHRSYAGQDPLHANP